MNQVVQSEQFYRPSEVAAVMRVGTGTISRAIRKGKLPAYRVGGQWRINGSDLMRYISDGTANALGASH